MESKHTPEAILNLPFDLKFLDNPISKPVGPEDQFHYQPTYEEDLKAWEAQEAMVMFENLRIEWDSCDCGDGYGCSHPDYPSQCALITDKGYDKELDFTFEDEGFYIEYKGKLININKSADITMVCFVQCLDLLGVPYKLKPGFVLPSREAEMLEALQNIIEAVRIQGGNSDYTCKVIRECKDVVLKAKGGKQ